MDAATNNLYFTLLKCRNCFTHESDEALQQIMLKCELLDGTPIAESEVHIVEADGSTDVNMSCKVRIEDNVKCWNRMANCPISIYMSETTLRDGKKKKATNHTVVGVACIDILPLMFHIPKEETWYRFFNCGSVTKFTDQLLLNDPEVCVRFTTEGSLLPEDFVSNLNVLSIYCDGYYNLPSELANNWKDYSYITNVDLPLENDIEMKVSYARFENGEISRTIPRTWYNSNGQLEQQNFIVGSEKVTIAKPLLEDHLRLYEAQKTEPQLLINSEKRILLTPEDCEKMLRYIAHGGMANINLTIRKSNQSPFSRPKRRQNAETCRGQVGKGSADLRYFLQPGSTELTALSFISRAEGGNNAMGSDLDTAVASKEDVRSIRNYKNQVENSLSANVRSTSRSTNKGDVGICAGSETENTTVVAPGVIKSTASTIFSANDFFLVLNLRLDKPLIRKKTMEEMSIEVKDVIYKNTTPPQSRCDNGLNEFHYVVRKVARYILDQKLDNDSQMKNTTENSEFPSINLDQFEDEIFNCIRNIMQERLSSEKDPTTDDISELYAYLVHEMNQAVDSADDEISDAGRSTSDVSFYLKQYGYECLCLGMFESADRYFLRAITIDPNSWEAWCEYGKSFLSSGQFDHAEQCFKEAYNLQPKSALALLLLAVTLSMRGEADMASLCLEYAIEASRYCYITRFVYALHLEHVGDCVGADLSYSSAQKIYKEVVGKENVAKVVYMDSYRLELDCSAVESVVLDTNVNAPNITCHTSKKPQSVEVVDVQPIINRNLSLSTSLEKSYSELVYSGDTADKETLSCLITEVAEFLLDQHAYSLAKFALEKATLSRSTPYTSRFYIAAVEARLKLGETEEAEILLAEALKEYFDDSELLSQLAELYIRQGKVEEAKQQYKTVFMFGKAFKTVRIVRFLLATLHYESSEYELARKYLLLVVKELNTPASLLWLGKTCYRLEEYDNAEKVLSESNRLDNSCGETWVYLSMICAKKSHRRLAIEAYKTAETLLNVKVTLLDEAKHLISKLRAY